MHFDLLVHFMTYVVAEMKRNDGVHSKLGGLGLYCEVVQHGFA